MEKLKITKETKIGIRGEYTANFVAINGHKGEIIEWCDGFVSLAFEVPIDKTFFLDDFFGEPLLQSELFYETKWVKKFFCNVSCLDTKTPTYIAPADSEEKGVRIGIGGHEVSSPAQFFSSHGISVHCEEHEVCHKDGYWKVSINNDGKVVSIDHFYVSEHKAPLIFLVIPYSFLPYEFYKFL